MAIGQFIFSHTKEIAAATVNEVDYFLIRLLEHALKMTGTEVRTSML